MKRAVVVVCGDAGGAAAVAPVAKMLQAEGLVTLRILAYRYALAAFEDLGLLAEQLRFAPKATEAAARLQSEGAALLITGSTVGPVEPEKPFIAAARACGIPSLAVLDWWSAYRERFADTSSALAYLPDRIAVMDERARTEMLAEGFDAATVMVTGAPTLDTLRETRAAFTEGERERLRTQMGAGADDSVVLFVSQPLRALHREGLGFTEKSVLAELMESLETLAQNYKIHVTLAIRPHPREDPREIALCSTPRVGTALAEGYSGRAWALASDLVVGMNSALLLEACCLGCVVVSLQPGLRSPDILPTNRSGMSLGVYAAEDLYPTLVRALCDPGFRDAHRARLASVRLPTGATRRIADLAYELGNIPSCRACP